MDTQIFMVTHKETALPKKEGYYPLMLGSATKQYVDLSYIRDDKGENISQYNDSYCELTGLYWMWKNIEVDNIGLVHYRRMFVILHKAYFKYRGRYIMFHTQNAYDILDKKEAEEILKHCDVIVKRSDWRWRTVWKIFVDYLGEEYCTKVKTVFLKEHREYEKSFNKIMGSHSHINCNMFIGKKKIIDAYCQWLFPILKRIDDIRAEETGNRYHNREIGYIGEMLFGVWLDYNNVKYKVQPVVHLEDAYALNGVMNLRQFFSFLGIKLKEKVKS